MYRYFLKSDNTNLILSWKSKGLSHESIKPPATSDNCFAPSLNYIGIVWKGVSAPLSFFIPPFFRK